MTDNQTPFPGDAHAPSPPYAQAMPPLGAAGTGGPYGPPQEGPYAPGGYGPPPSPGPVRPRILWIVIAWVIFVVLLILGVAGFARGLGSAVKDAASLTTFSAGESVSVRLDPKDRPAIYAAAEQAADVSCTVEGAPGLDIRLTRPSAAQSITYDGTTWEMVFQIGAPTAGDYQVSCTGEGVRFGVGKEIIGSVGKVVGGAVAMIALPSVGFLIAIVVTIVVLVRRAGARKRAMR
ncbi:hypothetical protein [Microtetraspora fusca]|uniref:hypothetical protein n=1 Tax=Microtetraspora fusca TaxID=1997 RepID=UPI000834BA32|nr:hypothetical protein [Microtetraspora fusca]